MISQAKPFPYPLSLHFHRAVEQRFMLSPFAINVWDGVTRKGDLRACKLTWDGCEFHLSEPLPRARDGEEGTQTADIFAWGGAAFLFLMPIWMGSTYRPWKWVSRRFRRVSRSIDEITYTTFSFRAGVRPSSPQPCRAYC